MIQKRLPILLLIIFTNLAMLFLAIFWWTRPKSQNNSTNPQTQFRYLPTASSSTKPSATPIPTQDLPTPNTNLKILNIFFIPESVSPTYDPAFLTDQLIIWFHNSTPIKYIVIESNTIKRSTTKYDNGKMDYNALLDEFNICEKLNSGTIDEVWIWVNGADGAGYEYAISGEHLSDPFSKMRTCKEKTLTVMGFDYTRTWDLALHSMGHRMEFVAKAGDQDVYLQFDSRNHRYFQQDQNTPLEKDITACGNIHFPPNGAFDYDYGNTRQVTTNCYNSTARNINCQEWSCTQEGYLLWWFGKIPKDSEWWTYFTNYSKTSPTLNTTQSTIDSVKSTIDSVKPTIDSIENIFDSMF